METTISTNKKEGFLRKLPFFASVFLAFLAPLFFIPTSSFPFMAGKMMLFWVVVALLVLAWIFEKIKEKKIIFSKNLLVISAFLVPLVYLVSALLSGTLMKSLVGTGFETDVFLVFASLFALMFLVAKAFDKKQVIVFYTALLLGGTLMAFIHILRIFLGADFLSFGILTSPVSNLIGSWNDLGVFFTMILLLSSLASDYLMKDKTSKIISIFAVLVSLFFVMLVNSRFLWVSLIVVTSFVLLFSVLKERGFFDFNLKKLFQRATTYIFLVSLIFAIFQTQIGHLLPNLAGTPNIEVRPTIGGTFEVAKNTATQNLMFGTGPNSFEKQWRLYKPLGVNITEFWNTDFSYGSSLVLTSLVSLGVFGFLAWLLFLASVLFYSFKLVYKKREDSVDKFMALSVASLALFGTLTLLFYTPGLTILILIVLIFGILLAQLKQNSLIKVKEISFSGSKMKSFFVALFLVLALVFVGTFSYFFTKKAQAAVYFNQAIKALNSEGGFNQGYQLLGKTIETQPNDFYFRNLTSLNLAQLQRLFSQEELSQEELQEQFQQIFEASVGSAQRALQLDAGNYLNWLSLAEVYGTVVPLKIEGSYEAAVDAYQKAQILNPTNPMLSLSLANLEIANGDTEKAKEYIQESVQLKQNYSNAYFLLSQLNLSEGNTEEAIQVIEQLATVSPYDPEAFFQLGAFKYEQKDYENARAYLERSVMLSPYYSDAKYLLGLTYNAAGEKEKAVGQFQDLKFLNPEAENIDKILSNIQDGLDPFAGFEQQTNSQQQEEVPQEENTEETNEEEISNDEEEVVE